MKKILILICIIALGFPLALMGCGRGAKQRAEIENLKAALERTESERDDLKTKMVIVAQTRQKLQKQVNELTSSRSQLQEKLTELAGSRDQLQEQLTELAGLRDQLQKQVDELTKSRDAAVTEAQKAQERIDELTKQLQAEMQKVRELQEQLTAAREKSRETSRVEAIERPTIHSFDTTRTQIRSGQSSTLSWQISNADSIRIEPGIGSVSALGSRTVKPSTTTIYTLIATNEAGESRETRTVEVI